LTEPAAAAAAEKDGRMTKEQLGELAEALSILSAKSSIVKERDELKQLMSDNIASEEVSARRTVQRFVEAVADDWVSIYNFAQESKLKPVDKETPEVSLNKRIRKMIKTIDNQLETYDEKVGSSLNTIQCNPQGQISLDDLKSAMQVIKHKPDDETIEAVCQKLDVDQDGFVVSSGVVAAV
jgi:LETM1 and EF-hand domain-containing protein 1